MRAGGTGHGAEVVGGGRLWRYQNRWTLLVLPAERGQFVEELVTRNPVPHCDLATAYLRKADYESAKHEIDLAGEMWPKNPAVARVRVMINRRARQARPAINAT